MRWIIMALLVANTGYVISNWVQFSRFNKVRVELGSTAADAQNTAMPGSRLTLIKEKSDVELNEKNNGDGYKSRESGTGTGNADTNGNRCTLIGPLKASEKWRASDVLSEAKALVIDAHLIDIESNDTVDYWVYIPPAATREIALLKLKELQKKQIDSYVIPEGDLTNSISLGVFDKKENAERRQSEISQFGYSAEIIQNRRKSNEIWLQVAAGLENKQIDELLLSVRQKDSAIIIKEDMCGDVASWMDIN